MERTQRIEIRVSPEEKVELAARAGDEPIGAWMRGHCLDGWETSSEEPAGSPAPAVSEPEPIDEGLIDRRAKDYDRYAPGVAYRMARRDVENGWRP